MTGRFVVDRDALDALIGRIEKFNKDVDGWIKEVDSRVSQLQTAWSGDAADAQLAAHQRWAAGAREMHTALEELRSNARTAHENYSAAVEANSRMWAR